MPLPCARLREASQTVLASGSFEALPGADMEPDEHGIFEIRIEAGSWHAALGQVFDAVSASGMMTTSPLPSTLGLPEHYRHGAGRP